MMEQQTVPLLPHAHPPTPRSRLEASTHVPRQHPRRRPLAAMRPRLVGLPARIHSSTCCEARCAPPWIHQPCSCRQWPLTGGGSSRAQTGSAMRALHEHARGHRPRAFRDSHLAPPTDTAIGHHFYLTDTDTDTDTVTIPHPRTTCTAHAPARHSLTHAHTLALGASHSTPHSMEPHSVNRTAIVQQGCSVPMWRRLRTRRLTACAVQWTPLGFATPSPFPLSQRTLATS